MIVPTVQHPDFVGHARSVRAERIIVALHVHNAFSLLLFLTHHVAENTALFVFEPLMRRAQFVLNAAWHKDGSGYLRMCVGPLFARESALIFEHANVFKAGVFFQIGDARGPDPKHAFHLVVYAFGQSARIAFDVIQRLRVRNDTNLPRPRGGPSHDGGNSFQLWRVQGALLRRLRNDFSLSQDDPTLRDGIFAKFHAISLAGITRGCGSLLQTVPVPDGSFAGVIGHFEILRQFEGVGGASILAQPAKHAA